MLIVFNEERAGTEPLPLQSSNTLSAEIKVEERDAVAHVRLERAEKRNALTGGMLERLAEIFAGVSARRDLRAVVLSGAGADFCAGTDIGELERLDEAGAVREAGRGREGVCGVEVCGHDPLARAIIEASAPLAVRACLEAVTRGSRLHFGDALKLEAELFARLFSTEDVREGTRAFLEKRRPSFRGQ